jgi:hypothetical protein
MTEASISATMSPKRLKVVERARTEPGGRFHSLAHLIDVPALERAFRRARKDAAVGVDGVTKEAYGEDLGGTAVVGVYRLAFRVVRDGAEAAAEATITVLGGQRLQSSEANHFGQALAVDGDLLVVGSPDETAHEMRLSGAVHIYERDAGAFVALQSLRAPEDVLGARFGEAVALADDTMFVGAPRRAVEDASGNSVIVAGEVFVYARQDGRWELAQRILSDEPLENARFGSTIALDGHRAWIGAPGASFPIDADSPIHLFGSVHEYVYENGRWVKVVTVEAPEPRNRRGFGEYLATSGPTLLVGTRGLGGTGAAFLLSRAEGRWAHSAQFEFDLVSSVDVEGRKAVVGGFNEVVTLERGDDPESWVETQRITEVQGLAHYGRSVVLRGERLAVGAPFENLTWEQSGGGRSRIPVSKEDGEWARARRVVATQPEFLGYCRTTCSSSGHREPTEPVQRGSARSSRTPPCPVVDDCSRRTGAERFWEPMGSTGLGRLGHHGGKMTKSELIKRLESLTDDQFSAVAPYLEADLEAADDLPALISEVEAGRESRDAEPLLTTRQTLAKARQRLTK